MSLQAVQHSTYTEYPNNLFNLESTMFNDALAIHRKLDEKSDGSATFYGNRTVKRLDTKITVNNIYN